MNCLMQKYTGNIAGQYEASRSQTRKWQREAKWFQECVDKINIETVLDAPVGTGRFLSLYQSKGWKITGLDSSPDMLAIAARKGAGSLIHGDIFHPPTLGTFDLVVCVRFLNWLDLNNMKKALSILSGLSHKWLIISITTSNGKGFTKKNGAYIPSILDFFDLAPLAPWHRMHELSESTNHSTSRMFLLQKK